MTVLLLILKIIGILLLSLIGIVLFLLVSVLFVPIRYQISGEIQEKVNFHGKIHCLLHMVSFSFSYEGQEPAYRLRIFGFPLRFGKKKKSELEEDFEDDFINETPKQETVVRQEELPKKASQTASEKKETSDDVTKNADIVPPQKQSAKKIKQLIHMLKQFPEKIADIKMLLTDETNRKSVSLIVAEIKYLLRHSKFRKIKTELKFSMADPAATGQVLGIICMIPVLYQYQINIYPDFESEKFYVKGDYFVKGHVRLVHGLCSIIRLWKEKEFRKFLNCIMKKTER